MKDLDTLYIKLEQINALAAALESMADYRNDNKWSTLAHMIRELSEEKVP